MLKTSLLIQLGCNIPVAETGGLLQVQDSLSYIQRSKVMGKI